MHTFDGCEHHIAWGKLLGESATLSPHCHLCLPPTSPGIFCPGQILPLALPLPMAPILLWDLVVPCVSDCPRNPHLKGGEGRVRSREEDPYNKRWPETSRAGAGAGLTSSCPPGTGSPPYLFMPPWKPPLPLHAPLEAPLLGPAEHVHPLAHGEVTGGGGADR